MKEGKLTDAILAFEAAVKLEPENSEAWKYVLSMSLLSALSVFISIAAAVRYHFLRIVEKNA